MSTVKGLQHALHDLTSMHHHHVFFGEHLLEDQLALHTLKHDSKYSQVIMPYWRPGCINPPPPTS